MALEASLEEFRRRWRAEISREPSAPAGPFSPKRRRSGESPKYGPQDQEEGEQWKCLPPEGGTTGSRYLQLAESLLDDRAHSTPKDQKPKSDTTPTSHHLSGSLVEQLIHDLVMCGVGVYRQLSHNV